LILDTLQIHLFISQLVMVLDLNIVRVLLLEYEPKYVGEYCQEYRYQNKSHNYLAPALTAGGATALAFFRLFSTLWGFNVIRQWDFGHLLDTVPSFRYGTTIRFSPLKKLLALHHDQCPIQKKDN